MEIATLIDQNWNAYDKSVAQCHIANYGRIFLDVYGHPIDNFDWIEANINDEIEEEDYW